MQLRRLDPLANAGPYKKLLNNSVKSFTLTDAQFERIRSERPELYVTEGDGAVVGFPYRDYLQIHYSYADFESFRENFPAMFEQVCLGSNKEESPRGAILHFRDRPNRGLSETVFWSVALDEGPEWVEMNHVSLPEQPEPADALGDGFSVREASDADLAVIGALDEANGLAALSQNGLLTLAKESKTGRLVVDGSGNAVGFFNLRGEPGGWGIIEAPQVQPDLREKLAGPVLRWSIAWLRNNNARRIRQQVLLNDNDLLAPLREAGFAPGETGLIYTRSVDPAEVQEKLEERKAHGALIRFGNWR